MQAVEIGKARVRLAQAAGHLDARSAALILYGLRLAAANIRFVERQQESADSLWRAADGPQNGLR